MANFIGLVYATLKAEGIDTAGMSTDEAVAKYNELQKEAGFDLSNYKGKNVTVYSCPVWNSDKLLNLIVYDGKIIGGDISDVAFDGEMKPLKK